LLIRGKTAVLEAAEWNIGVAIQGMEDEEPPRVSISYHLFRAPCSEFETVSRDGGEAERG
jgi:hypothetical protein